MIKSLTVTNQQGENMTLELTRPDKTGFIVKSIEGLGPVKANINTTNWANRGGAKYNSARLDTRNIVISLEFLQTDIETIEDLRHKSYRYFPEEEEVELVIETDTRVVKTTGRVEHNDVVIFTQNEGTQVSIICPDPYLYAVTNNVTQLSSIEPVFSFEFPAATTEEGNMVMSTIKNDNEGTVYNHGDVEVGVKMILRAGDASEGKIKISNLTNNEVMMLDVTSLPDVDVTKYVTQKNHVPGYWYMATVADDGSLSGSSNNRYITSEKIPAVPGTEIRFINMRVKPELQIISYYGETYLKDEAVCTPEKRWGTIYNEYHSETYIVPEGAKWFRITYYNGDNDQPSFCYTERVPTSIAKDDVILINTQFGEKSIQLIRDGVTVDVMNAINTDADWFTLKKGGNLFSYSSETGVESIALTIENKIAYRGI